MRLTFLLSLLISSATLFAQAPANMDEIVLEKGPDYKAAEPTVLAAANYLLTTPVNDKNADRLLSTQLIIKWMTGTPDFTFALDESITKMTKDNFDLLGLYMACATKYCLENPANAKDEKLVKLQSVKLLVAYCADEKNNVKLNKILRKLIKADKEGELEKELG